MELKTNEEGKATLNIVPLGSEVLVQVIVPGYRTFGQKYDVPTSEKSITIKMLPPNQQYSIYEKPKPEIRHAEQYAADADGTRRTCGQPAY